MRCDLEECKSCKVGEREMFLEELFRKDLRKKTFEFFGNIEEFGRKKTHFLLNFCLSEKFCIKY